MLSLSGVDFEVCSASMAVVQEIRWIFERDRPGMAAWVAARAASKWCGSCCWTVSVLLITTRTLSFSSTSRAAVSTTSGSSLTATSPLLPSLSKLRTTITTSLSSALALALRMPSCSTSPTTSPFTPPRAFLNPAVSPSLHKNPPKSMPTSTTSLVVPASRLTIAASRPTTALSSELLPAFGAPSSASEIPLRNNSPLTAFSRCASKALRSEVTCEETDPSSSAMLSSKCWSSLKSISASSSPRASSRSLRQLS